MCTLAERQSRLFRACIKSPVPRTAKHRLFAFKSYVNLAQPPLDTRNENGWGLNDKTGLRTIRKQLARLSAAPAAGGYQFRSGCFETIYSAKSSCWPSIPRYPRRLCPRLRNAEHEQEYPVFILFLYTFGTPDATFPPDTTNASACSPGTDTNPDPFFLFQVSGLLIRQFCQKGLATSPKSAADPSV